MKLSIKPSKVKDKRFVAIFTDDVGREIKRTNFGLKNPKVGTYIDHSDKTIRKNYIARHQVREKQFYKNPQRASTLSRFILWGESDDLETAIKNYKSQFNLK
tara:strand:+ start:1587 stop:1892 length:306 start_codon:yes stop_codon:yes gene_type:complete